MAPDASAHAALQHLPLCLFDGRRIPRLSGTFRPCTDGNVILSFHKNKGPYLFSMIFFLASMSNVQQIGF